MCSSFSDIFCVTLFLRSFRHTRHKIFPLDQSLVVLAPDLVHLGQLPHGVGVEALGDQLDVLADGAVLERGNKIMHLFNPV